MGFGVAQTLARQGATVVINDFYADRAIDVFVHNAGIPAQGWGYSKFLESPPSEWDAWLQLNLYGLMHACQALLPAMQARGWGRIVAINSDASRTSTGMGA